MKKPWIVLLSGLALAATAYAAFYLAGTTTAPLTGHGGNPELHWLKSSFQLDDKEYTRVCKLHAAYVPRCREMCQRIDQKNDELQKLVQRSTGVTPAIEQALREAAQLRLECQTMMLKYFFEVSQAMPPAEGKRYLAEMQQQTVLSTPRTLTRH